MGKVKEMWMTWQEEVATQEQLELPLEEQLKLAGEWFKLKTKKVKYDTPPDSS